MNRISRIEVEFAVPVELTDREVRTIAEIVNAAARRTETPEMVHWQSGIGSKPLWSRTDALLLGKDAAPNAPDSVEPEWDDSVLHIETCARPRHESEKER